VKKKKGFGQKRTQQSGPAIETSSTKSNNNQEGDECGQTPGGGVRNSKQREKSPPAEKRVRENT